MSKRKKSKSTKKGKTIDLTLRLNLELEQGKTTARERVKRIRSRKRPNLRKMRNGMGGLTAANLKQPNFFGNTALLTNAAMAAMNNKAYATERQLLDMQSEMRAQQQSGRQIADSTQQTIQALQNELALTRGMGQAAVAYGRQEVASTEARGKSQQVVDLKDMKRGAILKRISALVGVNESQLNLRALKGTYKDRVIGLIQAEDRDGLRDLDGPPNLEPEPESEVRSPSFASASPFDRDAFISPGQRAGVSEGDFNLSRVALESMITPQEDPLSPEQLQRLSQEKIQLARETEQANKASRLAKQLESTRTPLLKRQKHKTKVDRVKQISSDLQQQVSRKQESIRQQELSQAQSRGFDEGRRTFSVYDVATSGLRPGSPPQSPFLGSGGGVTGGGGRGGGA